MYMMPEKNSIDIANETVPLSPFCQGTHHREHTRHNTSESVKYVPNATLQVSKHVMCALYGHGCDSSMHYEMKHISFVTNIVRP